MSFVRGLKNSDLKIIGEIIEFLVSWAGCEAPIFLYFIEILTGNFSGMANLILLMYHYSYTNRARVPGAHSLTPAVRVVLTFFKTEIYDPS